ncbi:MAG: FdhF/YdeP family oxidoreductase, partial [Nocardiaceae bacterium]|nr:FdhF/YdeP family oxidoreductase [Nocardiaceae bacterium]
MTRVRVTKPKSKAAGLPAVLVTMRRALRQMGVRRTARTLYRVNQPNGFDCPGCAWGEPKDRRHAEFCENGAKAVAEEATTKRVGPEFFAEHSVADLARQTGYWLGQRGRLTHPMVRQPGAEHYEPISWDDAYDLIAQHLRDCDPNEAVFYTSGRTSNEAAFVYQLFARSLGTNNLPDCSNMCHESSGTALNSSIGIGKGSVTIEDVETADLVIVAGQNPGTNHPRMLTTLAAAKRNGARIIAINPLPEAGLFAFADPQKVTGLAGQAQPLADDFLQIRIGGDLALFQGLGRLLVEAGAEDREFIEQHCAGYGEWAEHISKVDLGTVVEATGLTLAQIESAAGAMASAERIVICWAMGLTQHEHAVATIEEATNLLLLRGMIGKPGAGLCPVRGHSNVQGDRTMGIFEQMPEAFLTALDQEFGISSPRPHGYDTVNAIRAMRDGKVKVFMAMGGNFAEATPDSDVTAEALRNCALTVQVSTKLNHSHTITGETALILPSLGRTDLDLQDGVKQHVSVEDSMSMVHLSTGRLTPASSELRSEVAIVCELAQRVLGPEHPVRWGQFARNYDLIRDSIENVVPGFEDYNRRVRSRDGFLLPHPPRDSREFHTGTGRANFAVNDLHWVPTPEGRLVLQTLRSHDQFNTTIYGLDDRYRGVKGGRRVIFVNPEDIAALGYSDGDTVDLVSEWNGTERRAGGFRIVAYSTQPGNAA